MAQDLITLRGNAKQLLSEVKKVTNEIKKLKAANQTANKISNETAKQVQSQAKLTRQVEKHLAKHGELEKSVVKTVNGYQKAGMQIKANNDLLTANLKTSKSISDDLHKHTVGQIKVNRLLKERKELLRQTTASVTNKAQGTFSSTLMTDKQKSDELKKQSRLISEQIAKTRTQIAQGENQVYNEHKLTELKKQETFIQGRLNKLERQRVTNAQALKKNATAFRQTFLTGAIATTVFLLPLNSIINKAGEAEKALMALERQVEQNGILGSQAKNTLANMDIVQNGLISIAAAGKAVRNLMRIGFSFDDAIKSTRQIAEIAVENKQSALTLEQAVISTTEGFRQELSTLADAGGITKNISVIYSDYAKTLGKTVESLTQVEKAQALQAEIQHEATISAGALNDITKSLSGNMTTLSGIFTIVQQQLGLKLKPVIMDVVASMRELLATMSKFVQDPLGGILLKYAGYFTLIIAKLATMTGALYVAYKAIKTVGAGITLLTGVINPWFVAIGGVTVALVALYDTMQSTTKEAEALSKVKLDKQLGILANRSKIATDAMSKLEISVAKFKKEFNGDYTSSKAQDAIVELRNEFLELDAVRNDSFLAGIIQSKDFASNIDGITAATKKAIQQLDLLGRQRQIKLIDQQLEVQRAKKSQYTQAPGQLFEEALTKASITNPELLKFKGALSTPDSDASFVKGRFESLFGRLNQEDISPSTIYRTIESAFNSYGFNLGPKEIASIASAMNKINTEDVNKINKLMEDLTKKREALLSGDISKYAVSPKEAEVKSSIYEPINKILKTQNLTSSGKKAEILKILRTYSATQKTEVSSIFDDVINGVENNVNVQYTKVTKGLKDLDKDQRNALNGVFKFIEKLNLNEVKTLKKSGRMLAKDQSGLRTLINQQTTTTELDALIAEYEDLDIKQSSILDLTKKLATKNKELLKVNEGLQLDENNKALLEQRTALEAEVQKIRTQLTASQKYEELLLSAMRMANKNVIEVNKEALKTEEGKREQITNNEKGIEAQKELLAQAIEYNKLTENIESTAKDYIKTLTNENIDLQKQADGQAIKEGKIKELTERSKAVNKIYKDKLTQVQEQVRIANQLKALLGKNMDESTRSGIESAISSVKNRARSALSSSNKFSNIGFGTTQRIQQLDAEKQYYSESEDANEIYSERMEAIDQEREKARLDLITSTSREIKNSIVSNLMDGLNRTKSWSEAFVDILKNMVNRINQIVLERATEKALGGFINSIAGSIIGGFGGVNQAVGAGVGADPSGSMTADNPFNVNYGRSAARQTNITIKTLDTADFATFLEKSKRNQEAVAGVVNKFNIQNS